MKRIRYLRKPHRLVIKRRRDERRLATIFIGVLVILLAALCYYYPRVIPSKSLMYREGQHYLRNFVRPRLARGGFREVQIDSDLADQINLAFEFPEHGDDQRIIDQVKAILHQKNLAIRKINQFTSDRGFLVFVDYYQQPAGSISFLKGANLADFRIKRGDLLRKPRLAILIDDFGYSNNEVIKGFIRLKSDLTMSIIPGHRFSRWTAVEGKKFNKEIIVHMPMEPENSGYMHGEEQYIIKSSLYPSEIERRLTAALMEIPEAVGLNNHMGSLATAHQHTMQLVMNSLRKKGIYFVDSLTSPRSVAFEVARSSRIPTAVRSVFLDNNRNKSEIQTQFETAIEIAKRQGYAIAIGHVYLETLEVLQELLQSGYFSDISLVYVSEIVS